MYLFFFHNLFFFFFILNFFLNKLGFFEHSKIWTQKISPNNRIKYSQKNNRKTENKNQKQTNKKLTKTEKNISFFFPTKLFRAVLSYNKWTGDLMFCCLDVSRKAMWFHYIYHIIYNCFFYFTDNNRYKIQQYLLWDTMSLSLFSETKCCQHL